MIEATGEMKKIKHFIYQASFDYGLEKAQVPAEHELQKLKVQCPNSLFRETVETEDQTELFASTNHVAEQSENQHRNWTFLLLVLVLFASFFFFFFIGPLSPTTCNELLNQ